MIGGMTTISGRSTTERDIAGEEALITQHLALVNYAVNELMTRVPRHVTRDDLVSAGMEGLCQAARSYDPSRGVPFRRYASTRIKGALIDDMRRGDWASRSVRVRARTVKAATETVTARLGRTPTTAEIAEAADMAPAAVHSVQEDLVRAAIVKFGGLQSGEQEMISDGRAPDNVLLERERSAYLLDAVNALPERLRHVVVGYFFEERPMQELADELGVTESRISQMRAEALLLLKDGLNSQLDPEHLPRNESTRVAKRKAAYYTAIATGSNFRDRVSTQPTLVATARIA